MLFVRVRAHAIYTIELIHSGLGVGRAAIRILLHGELGARSIPYQNIVKCLHISRDMGKCLQLQFASVYL